MVYILHCSDDTLYTGITNDLKARIAAHNSGKGARYTAGRRPVRLIYVETAVSRSAALKREWTLKRYSRQKKMALAAAGEARNKAPLDPLQALIQDD